MKASQFFISTLKEAPADAEETERFPAQLPADELRSRPLAGANATIGIDDTTCVHSKVCSEPVSLSRATTAAPAASMSVTGRRLKIIVFTGMKFDQEK